MKERFDRFAERVAEIAGSAWAFLVALLVVICWAASGPFLDFSEMWQLTINTATTIITSLMVFVIQNTQNRHEAAMQAKLDELIRAIGPADNSLIGAERS